MPCSGNSKEICGGASLISLYQKCQGSSCVNIDLTIINGSVSTISAAPPSTSSAPPTAVGVVAAHNTMFAAGNSVVDADHQSSHSHSLRFAHHHHTHSERSVATQV